MPTPKRYLTTFLFILVLFACNVEQIDGPLGIADEGDPCAAEGLVACTNDFSAELRCTGGEFLLYQMCEGDCGLIGDPEAPQLQCLGADGKPKS
ncbi:MAG: hypothetical protein HUU55_16105 [Myxococcales bacterium]|nr:hypothetical protein [Myxococcales bacterium]